jgi:hypothetical protein
VPVAWLEKQMKMGKMIVKMKILMLFKGMDDVDGVFGG